MKISATKVSYGLNTGVQVVSVGMLDPDVVCIDNIKDVDSSETFLDIIECALSRDDDLIANIQSEVKSFNIMFNDNTSISLNDGKIVASLQKNIACVRLVGSDTIRTSVYSDSQGSVKLAETNKVVYSDILSIKGWSLLEVLVNKVLGFNFVSFSNMNREISFNWDSNYGISFDVCKSVYLLLADIVTLRENFTGYIAVLISGISNYRQSALSEALDTLVDVSQVFYA